MPQNESLVSIMKLLDRTRSLLAITLQLKWFFSMSSQNWLPCSFQLLVLVLALRTLGDVLSLIDIAAHQVFEDGGSDPPKLSLLQYKHLKES